VTPGQARVQSLKVLRRTRRAMMSDEWLESLEGAEPADRARAARALLNVNAAITRIENADLATLRDALEENEAAISAGIERLDRAIGNLHRVKTVLAATEQVLALGARVAPLLV